jgi:alkylation response protein AidB-like acyl-CoA dehydrogenase
VDFSFSVEQKMLRDAARDFAQKEIRPIADEIDEKSFFPKKLFKKCGELGFLGCHIPEEYGGGGMGYFSRAIIDEEFSKVVAGFSMTLHSSALYGGNNILLHGTKEQQEKYLPGIINGDLIACWALTEPEAGSDAFGIQTYAEKDGDY